MAFPLLININHELANYLSTHESEIPTGIDKDTLWILCDGFKIDNIEDYTNRPYESEFQWRVRFNNSADEEKDYTYLINYKAYFQGESGIIKAKLIK